MSVENIKPYDAEADKKAQVSAMFDNIAHRYDFLNHFLSLGIDKGWRRRAVAQLKPYAPQRILDVATGTGDLALALHKGLTPQSIVGVDISTGMLEKGREKIAKRGLSEYIRLDEGDSENLPFEDASFDAVTVAFGVRNFGDVRRGLSEMLRVLRPGGQCLILEFSKPKGFPFKQGFQFYFRFVLPLVGRITSKDRRAYTYLFESVQAFPEGQEFVELLESVGFGKVRLRRLTGGVCSIYQAEKPL